MEGYLEDYAFLANACVDLFEVGARPEDLHRAQALTQRMVADFRDDESGAFYSTAHTHERLLLRRQDAQDGALPSPNAVAAGVLARMSYHLNDPQLRDMAAGVITSFGRIISRVPRAFIRSLLVVDLLRRGPTELALVEGEGAGALRNALAKHYLPHRVVARGLAEHPLLRGRSALEGCATLYICRDYTCRAPLTDPAAVDAALGEHAAQEAPREEISAPAP